MPSDVKTPGLVINTLTQEQFDDLINPSDTELFLTPDTTAEDIADAVSTHNTSNTAHNDIRQAISNKSTVSVSATGTTTDEVQYIIVDGVEKKLAGGSGGVEYTAGQGININPTTHVITNTDHQYMPYNVSTNNKLTCISDVSMMAYEYGSYFKGNYDTWTDVPTDQWEYRKNMGRDSTPTENDIIFVKDISDYEDIIAINPPLENGGLDLAYGYETEALNCIRTHSMYRLNSSATYTIRIKKENYTGSGTLSARLFYYKTDINHQYTNFVSNILPVVFNENDYCDVKLKPDDYCSRLVIYTNGDDITYEDFNVEFIEDVDTTYPQIGAVFGYYGTWEENGKDGWKINYTLNTSSGGATWGSINGTLSNQTDLQNALNAKLENEAEGMEGTVYIATDGAGLYSNSTVIGKGTVVSSEYSTVYGCEAISEANSTVVIGDNARVSANYGTAIGSEAQANGEESIQIGYGNNEEDYTFSVGFSSYSSYKLLDGTTGVIPYERLSTTTPEAEQVLYYNEDEASLSWKTINVPSYTPGIGISISNNTISAVRGNWIWQGNGLNSVVFGDNAFANNNGGIAIGYQAIVNASNSIQLGQGTNNTQGSLQFKNYSLFDTNGLIVKDRLSSTTPSSGQALIYNGTSLTWTSIPTSDNAFEAIFGETTLAELNAAVQAGKLCYCKYNGRVYYYSMNEDQSHYFTNIHLNWNRRIYLSGYTNDWHEETISDSEKFETLSHKVTSISSSSTDDQYPTAKCVYDIVGDIEATLQAIRGV